MLEKHDKVEAFLKNENDSKPKSIDQASYIININSENSLPEELISNSISTSKYTYLNCVPKILLEQFSKIANIYFLIIAVMQV